MAEPERLIVGSPLPLYIPIISQGVPLQCCHCHAH